MEVAPEPQHVPEAEQEAADPPEVRAGHPAVAAAAECADTLADTQRRLRGSAERAAGAGPGAGLLLQRGLASHNEESSDEF